MCNLLQLRQYVTRRRTCQSLLHAHLGQAAPQKNSLLTCWAGTCGDRPACWHCVYNMRATSIVQAKGAAAAVSADDVAAGLLRLLRLLQQRCATGSKAKLAWPCVCVDCIVCCVWAGEHAAWLAKGQKTRLGSPRFEPTSCRTPRSFISHLRAAACAVAARRRRGSLVQFATQNSIRSFDIVACTALVTPSFFGMGSEQASITLKGYHALAQLLLARLGSRPLVVPHHTHQPMWQPRSRHTCVRSSC